MSEKMSGKELFEAGDKLKTHGNEYNKNVVFDFGGAGWIPIGTGDSLLTGFGAAKLSAISTASNKCQYCGMSFMGGKSDIFLDVVLKDSHVEINDGQFLTIGINGKPHKEKLTSDDLNVCCKMCRPYFNLIEAGEEHKGSMVFLPELSQGDLTNILRVIYMIKYYTSKGVLRMPVKPEEPSQDASAGEKNIYREKMKTFEKGLLIIERLNVLLPVADAILSFLDSRKVRCQKLYGTSRPQDFGRMLEESFKGAAEGSDDIFNRGSLGGENVLVENSGGVRASLPSIHGFDVDTKSVKNVYRDRKELFYGLRLFLPGLMMEPEEMINFVSLNSMDNAFDQAKKMFKLWKDVFYSSEEKGNTEEEGVSSAS